MNHSMLRFLLTVIVLAAAVILLYGHTKDEPRPARAPLSSLPLQLGAWQGADYTIDKETLDILGAGEFLARSYGRSISEPPIELFIAYFPSQRAGDTIHSPSHCLPGAGWVPTQRTVVQLPRGDGSTFPSNRYVVSKAGDRQLVLYWYQAHNRAVASEYWSKYYLIADSIRMNRSDGALVRLVTAMYRGETPDAAQARIWSLGGELVPLLDTYIPR